jgi:hypothetical protein
MMMSSATNSLVCHRCSRLLTPGKGSFYVVRIEAFCDPTPPEIDARESLDDLAIEWEQLLDSMRDMSERELMDQVYRRLTLHLCSDCYRQWIENPAP